MIVKCLHCGYDWDYGGKSDFYVCCPKCSYKIFIGDDKQRGSLLSISGARQLEQMVLDGATLPPTWKRDIERAIKIIDRMAEMKKHEWLNENEDFKEFLRVRDVLYAYNRKL